MYLKRIEVHGFKSFANKITFQFHNGITGIVGPNGSGKSNVADAVRWVLGEKSVKQLRGASMQDVIFSGTEMRKPMGYAYVSITLDISDHQLPVEYEEVTVTRRVYRSGESEYLINGTACRLKDINEMFYDTGIGKEGYSIIGQGQIDKILSGKPEERRELFDEAAGIVKFKRRKDTAVKKLEEERNNLVRLTDIISEQEIQKGPLEKQAEVAKDFLKKKEELKKLDANMFLLESDRSKKLIDELTEKYNIAFGDFETVKSEHENIKEEYSQVETKIEELNLLIEEKRKLLTENSLKKEKLQGEIKALNEAINAAKNSVALHEKRKEDIGNDIEAKNRALNNNSESKQELDDSLGEMEKQRDDAKNVLSGYQKDIEDINSNIEKHKNEIIEILNERATIKASLGRFDTMLEQLKIRKAQMQSRLLQAKSEEAEHENIIKKLYEELNDASSEILKLDGEKEEIERSLSDFRKTLEKKDSELGAAQLKFHEEKSRLESLKNLSERYEGYGNSIRAVMEQKDDNKGIIGVVSDILNVDKKYEIAIETALGGNIQNIVTSDEQVAKKMIKYLKDNKAGRATFLPLTSVKGRGEYDRPEVRDEKGFIGMANELVEAESKYAGVISQLLGAIIVVDHIDNALLMAKKYQYLLRIVTLDGEYITPGGALAGGAFKSSSNLLGRKREIEELEKKVENLETKLNDIRNEIENTKNDRNVVRDKLEKIKQRQQDLYLRQNTAQVNVDKAIERKRDTVDGYKNLEIEGQEVDKQVINLEDSKKNSKSELLLSEEKETKLEVGIAKLGQDLDKLRDLESHQVLKVTELELEVGKLKQKQEFSQQTNARIEEEKKKLFEQLAEVDQQLKAIEEEVEFKKNSIASIEETILASENDKDENATALQSVIDEKESYTQKQKGFFEKREELSDRMSKLDKEVYRLEQQKNKAEESQEALVNYMWYEYELTLTTAASLRDEELTDVGQIRKSVSALKESIKKLGDVNVNAIEDYKNLMERYTFLKGQHDDLVEAEKTLVDIIAELDEAMRKQFNDKFKEIGQEFDKVFKELFGGGKGTLELNDDEDILEAGIRIIAQPPGKKLQNMIQLSGGEKALAAIALLFAIQNLKPSPFCLLDEIEAALDESNVGRFAGYLNKLTKHTQFIVITHRRGTMEKADRLYGITMQEKGVSALVSVNLIDKDLDN